MVERGHETMAIANAEPLGSPPRREPLPDHVGEAGIGWKQERQATGGWPNDAAKLVEYSQGVVHVVEQACGDNPVETAIVEGQLVHVADDRRHPRVSGPARGWTWRP